MRHEGAARLDGVRRLMEEKRRRRGRRDFYMRLAAVCVCLVRDAVNGDYDGPE
jgi:hypothetical protein